MSRTSKNNRQQSSETKNIILRLTVILAINITTISGLCTYFYLSDKDVYKNFFLILIVLSAADFISAYYIGRKIKTKGMICGIVYNLPTIFICTLISLILNNFIFGSGIFILPAVRITSAAVGGIVAVNSKVKHKRK